MDKLELARQLLKQIKMPVKHQSNLCCLALLAMAKLKKRTPWCKATNEWMRIHDVLDFIKNNYGVSYAENSRETFRKQAMHPFRTASLISLSVCLSENKLGTENCRFRLFNSMGVERGWGWLIAPRRGIARFMSCGR